MNNKDKYHLFCDSEQAMPIFSKAWWLDATCGKAGWDVVTIEKDNKIIASLPFKKSKRAIFNVLSQPELTQKLGPYIVYPKNQKYEKRLSFEKKVINELIDRLPEFDFFAQNCDRQLTNWLPFYWSGFKQTTNYTYILEDLSDMNVVWKNLNNKTRTDIRNAEKLIDVEVSDDLELFYQINKMTFTRQSLNIPYSIDFLKRLDSACADRECRKILLARDKDNKIHAAIYLVWDDNTVYYLMGGANPELRSSGAMHLLIWEAIKFTASISRTFDFEGSMMEQVEKFVRSFGAYQAPYHSIQKTNSKLLKLREFVHHLREK